MSQGCNLEDVERYLRENAGLRAAVGAGPSAVLEPRPLGEGEHNCNYAFSEPSSGCAYVLRVNVAVQPFHDDQVGYEFGALQTLAPSGRTPQPVYLDNSPEAPAKGAMVIGFCEGDELNFDQLRPGDLRCAAQIMADVHAVPVGAGCPVFRPADPLRELFGECLQRFNLYRESAYEDPRITKWAEAFIAQAQELLDTSFEPGDCSHVINTETLPSHFLIPAESAADAAQAPATGGRFCDMPGSFVDWERPIVGEVAQDLAYFTSPTTTYWDSEFLFPGSQVADFVEDYWRAVDGRFERGTFPGRFKAFRAMTALRSVTWCCRALITYGEGVAHTTEKTRRKLPVYLSDDFMHLVAQECFGL